MFYVFEYCTKNNIPLNTIYTLTIEIRISNNLKVDEGKVSLL